jgi:septal ring factor EnvC (AmiA/AmiB activator)
MAVRTRLSWPWRAVIGAVLVAIVVGMWWWGFDFGQIFNRDELNAQLASREAEARELRNEMAQLVARSSLLERELAMAKGSQATLSRQLTELQTENSQLKDELGFMKNLVADSNKQTGLTIQRLAAGARPRQCVSLQYAGRARRQHQHRVRGQF